MTALPTSYIVNNGNYNNQDLNTIFAPISSSSTYNYDYGTYVLNYTSNFSSTTYKGFINGANQAFSSNSNNGIVTFGLEASQSYLIFDKPGIYELKLSFKSTVTPDSDSGGYLFSNKIRLNGSTSTDQDSIPTNFNVDRFINISFNGNTSTGNGNTGTSTGNLIYTYRNSSEAGYLFLNPYIYSTSGARAYFNLYTLSIVFILYDTDVYPFNIYPQITTFSDVGNKQSYNYGYNGNWMVTKLGDVGNPNIGSLLGTGTGYATGNASKNLAAEGQTFTIEMFININQDSYQNLFMLGSSTGFLYIYYDNADKRIYLKPYNSDEFGTTKPYTNPLTVNNWYHLAVTCNTATDNDEMNFNMYLNGTTANPPGFTEKKVDFNANTSLITIGNTYNSTQALIGNISNVRLTQKVVYTGNFTPPTVPLQTTQSASTNISAITGQECVFLLECSNSNPFKDTVTGVNLTNNGLTFSYASPP